MLHQQAPAELGQQINEIILNSSDSETTLQQLAQVLGEEFQVDYCLVIVASKHQDAGSIAHWYSNKALATVSPQHQTLWSRAQLASALQHGSEPLVIDNVNSVENSFLEQWLHLLPSVQAVLAISTWFQGQINGVILLVRSQPHQWTDLEKQQLKDISSPVAIAICQVMQTRLIKSLEQEVRTSADYQSLINRLTMASRSSLELNQILNLAIAGTVQALQVERGLLLLLKYADPLFKTRSKKQIPKAKATVVCEWTSSNEPSLLETLGSTCLDRDKASSVLNQSFFLSECHLCQQAFTNYPRPLVLEEHDLLAVDNIAPLFNLDRLSALLMLPLESQGTILGFIVLQQPGNRVWHSEELALVELVSAQLSTAIIQSQTLRQVQSLVEKRTTQLQRSLEVQSRLYEKTRQQIDQLRHLNQLKDEFVSTMNHELRTPLTSMSLAIRMLRQSGLTPERQAKYLDILEQQCNQEINLINDLLKLQELESRQFSLKLETIDLKSKIDNLAESFPEKWADKGLNITVDLPKRSLRLQTDVDSFDRILQELLSNAGKYSEPDTTVVLKATHQVEPEVNQIVITLTNIGSGISPEDATHIFDKFRRGQGVTQQAIQGTGLGLALVKCLVQNLNGAIAVSSCSVDQSSSYKTSFTVTLPQVFASP